MLKLMGILLVLVGAAGYGRKLCAYLDGHLSQLLTFRDILVQIDSGREYLCLPYPQLLYRIAAKSNEFPKEMLFSIAEEMEMSREADVEVLWRQAFKDRKGKLLLLEDEREIVITLAKNLAFEGQSTKICQVYFMQMEDKIVQAMEEKKEKQKLYGAVSVLGGLFLVILLL